MIAYLPTWCEHNTISQFYEPLQTLAKENRLVIKPHAFTQPKDLEKLKNLSKWTLNDWEPFSKVIAAADIILVDAKSGAYAESILLSGRVPVIALTPYNEETFFDEAMQGGPYHQ